MNDMLYCIKLVDDSENFDLAAEMLAALELESSSFEDKENKRVCHTIYAADPETAAENLALVTNAVKEWTPLGVRISAIEPFELKKEDWAEVWKKYFDVIPVSETLVIKPSWLDVQRKPGMAVVEIDPGMSFGTGQHATTYYCLKTIDRLAGKPGVKSMLDAGCGSGILTIAAALRGYDPVDAFDNDPDAVRIAAENLALNRIGTVSPVVGDAAVWQGRAEQYDLVCANILGHLLVAFRNNIVSWVRPGGYLTLAGILSTEFDGVAAAFIELGFEELDRETLREWTSGLFRKR
ncbi:50S ribosomal protein L11 methyltransferase [Victivallaceae bacterium BBE-744-WT-12]|uniref:Ribosomal protein L11 methyltransferase n=1 Tax=Victivallis lenta TaxID=2606640 RepID=A0A844G5P2_9BACT|nr:50S ribosomal protein L11 methyltransferase [Victivallis lenta]MST98463.1 50S ribosomal protein L11 methyltransferase [Victivallis lenta]